MIQLLTELEHSGMSRNKELAARLLNHLVVSAPRLVQPYTEPILKVLVPKLKEPESNSGVILAVLRAIGDLAGVSGADMQPWMPELLSILLKILVDASSSEKRAVALWVLGQLIGSTGHVVKPYMQVSYKKQKQNFLTLLTQYTNFSPAPGSSRRPSELPQNRTADAGSSRNDPSSRLAWRSGSLQVQNEPWSDRGAKHTVRGRA